MIETSWQLLGAINAFQSEDEAVENETQAEYNNLNDRFQQSQSEVTNISGRVLDGDQRSKRFIVARVLGHTDKEVTGIYDRYEYLDEKETALQGWADLVTSWVSSSS